MNSKDFPEGSVLYICDVAKTDADGSRYMDIAQADSVPYGIPFVAYIPNAQTGETVDIVMRSRMALSPNIYIIDKKVRLTGTFKNKTVANACTEFDESDGRVYLRKAADEQTVLPFTAYLENEGNVELRNYKLLDEISENIENVISENNGQTVKTVLKRTFAKDKWNTLVLPFDVSADVLKAFFGNDMKVAEYSNTENADIYFTSTQNGIKANVPVLIKPTSVAEDNRYMLNDATYVSGTPQAYGFNYSFIGSYKPYNLAEGDYMLYGDKWWRTGQNDHYYIKAFRAYIRANAGTNAVKKLNLVIDGQTTGLTVNTVTGNVEENVYNTAGQRVNATTKGVVISNGKKMLRR